MREKRQEIKQVKKEKEETKQDIIIRKIKVHGDDKEREKVL